MSIYLQYRISRSNLMPPEIVTKELLDRSSISNTVLNYMCLGYQDSSLPKKKFEDVIVTGRYIRMQSTEAANTTPNAVVIFVK